MSDTQTIPSPLYHYTSVQTLKSIIATRTMRATRYNQMNDRAEVDIGVALLRDAIRRHDVAAEDQDYKAFLLSGVESFQEEPLDVYVLSLSAEDDSLDQWRAYTPEGGVAVGFNSKAVQRGFLIDITSRVGGEKVDDPIRLDPENRLMQCRYTDKNGGLDLSDLVADRFFKPSSYPAMFRRESPFAQQLFVSSLSVMVYRTICSLKHGAFRSEREWRCVNYRPSADKYPVKLSEDNRHYIEMTFDPSSFIEEVWISPHGDTAGIERAISYLRQQHNLSFEVRQSKIPFQG